MLEYLWAHKEYMIFWTAVWIISFSVFGAIMYVSVRKLTSAIQDLTSEIKKNQAPL